jgi:hypothetical protein
MILESEEERLMTGIDQNTQRSRLWPSSRIGSSILESL